MKLEKIKKTYNDYKLELSWGQIEAIANALSQNHSDPLADELFAEWQWYMERVPGPGEDEEELEAEAKAAEEGAVEGEDIPVAMPPGRSAGTPPEGGEEIGPPSEEEMAAAEGGGEMGLPEPEPGEVETETETETAYELPEPPRE